MEPCKNTPVLFSFAIFLAVITGIFGCDSQRVRESLVQPTPRPTPTHGIITTPTNTPTPFPTPLQQQIELSKSKFHERNLNLVTENYDLAIIVGAPLTNIRSHSHRSDYEIDSGSFVNEAP